MKKALLYTLLAVVGILVVCPYVAGKKLKEGYFLRMDSVPEQPGITFKNHSYKQGWFTSSVLTLVDVDLEALTGKQEFHDIPASFLVRSEFSHGPILFSQAGVRFGLGYGHLTLSAPEQADPDSLLLDWLVQAPVQIYSLIYFDQSAQTEVEVASYESDEGDEHVRFGGASISLKTNSSMTRYDGSVIFQPSSILGESFTLSMNESSGSMNYEGATPYTLEGESVFNLNAIHLVDEQLSIKVENLSINNGSQKNGETMDYFQTIEIESVEAPIPVTAGKWHMEFNAIPISALELWVDVAEDLEVIDETQPDVSISEELQAKLDQLAEAINQPGINFKQRLDLVALGGDHEASFNFIYKGLPDNQSLLDTDDPMVYMQAFDGTFLLKANEQAVMNSPFQQMVMPYVQQGLLLPNEGTLVLDAQLNDGQLSVNGNVIPVEQMLQSALASPEGESSEEQNVSTDPALSVAPVESVPM